jgi:CRP/FNR family transcriptional regulator
VSRSRVQRNQEAIDTAKRRLLAANDLLGALDDETMARVSQMADLTTCPAGQILFGPENSGETLFFLKKGRVQLYKLNLNGKKLVLHDLKAGSFFGEMYLLGQGMADNYAETTEESLICALSRVDVEALLESRPEAALRVIDHLARRVDDAEVRLAALAHERLDARLAVVLLRERDSDDGVVRGLSQQDLADRVGATRESVSRLLGRMSRRGLIRIGRRRIGVLDPDGIRRLIDR